MNFGSAIKSCLRQYAGFAGRASRGEYWLFMLFTGVLEAAANLLFGGKAATIIGLALLLPSLAVSARRMHDIGRRGRWMLIVAIPLVGWIYWVFLASQPGWRKYNRFGPNPLSARA